MYAGCHMPEGTNAGPQSLQSVSIEVELLVVKIVLPSKVGLLLTNKLSVGIFVNLIDAAWPRLLARLAGNGR